MVTNCTVWCCRGIVKICYGKVPFSHVEVKPSSVETSNGAVKHGKVALRCALVAYCQGEVTYGASWSG